MTVKCFLSEQFQIPKDINDMMYHTGITYCDVKEVLSICNISLAGKNKDQVAMELAEALLSCYSQSENFNEKLYFQLVRKGTLCSDFNAIEEPENYFEDESCFGYSVCM